MLVVSSSLAILLACVPLYDALRSSGPRRAAHVLLAPLALFALLYLAQVARSPGAALVVEAVKWCAVLSVAVWLSIAQVAALRGREAPRERGG